MAFHYEWEPWASVSQGDSTPGAQITAVAWQNDLALFLADRGGGVYTCLGDPQKGFGPWSSVSQGGTTPGGTVTALPSEKQIALFLADPGGGVYTCLGDPQRGFGPWSSVSQGRTTPGGTVTALPWGNQVALFLADPAGGVYSLWGTPGHWGDWASVSQGSTVPGAPVAPFLGIIIRSRCFSPTAVAESTRVWEIPNTASAAGRAYRRGARRQVGPSPRFHGKSRSRCFSPILRAGFSRFGELPDAGGIGPLSHKAAQRQAPQSQQCGTAAGSSCFSPTPAAESSRRSGTPKLDSGPGTACRRGGPRLAGMSVQSGTDATWR